MKVRRRAHPLMLGRKSLPSTHQYKWRTGEVWSGDGLRIGKPRVPGELALHEAEQKRVVEARVQAIREVLKNTAYADRSAVRHAIKARGEGWELARALNSRIVTRTKELSVKPPEAKPAEAKPAEAKPAEAKPVEAKPAKATKKKPL